MEGGSHLKKRGLNDARIVSEAEVDAETKQGKEPIRKDGGIKYDIKT